MSRNSSGTYSLPALNPVVSGTTIATAWANGTLNDLATEITNSLDRSGRGGMLAPILTTDGTVAAPTHSFTNETGSGLYRAAAGDIRLAVLGVDRIRMGPTASAPAISFSSPQTGAGTQTDFLFNTTSTRTAGNIVDAQNNGTSLFTLPAAGSALLKGSVADGASAVGNIFDTVNTLSTNGAKIASFRTGGAEHVSIGSGYLAISMPSSGGSKRLLMGNQDSGGANNPSIVQTANGTLQIGNGNSWTGNGGTFTSILSLSQTGYAHLDGSNPASSTGFTNTLTPSNIVKAWGFLTCGAAGAITVTKGFNVSDASYSGDSITVNLVTALDSTNYVPIANVIYGAAGYSMQCGVTDANTFHMTATYSTGSHTWVASDKVGFIVMGFQ